MKSLSLGLLVLLAAPSAFAEVIIEGDRIVGFKRETKVAKDRLQEILKTRGKGCVVNFDSFGPKRAVETFHGKIKETDANVENIASALMIRL